MKKIKILLLLTLLVPVFVNAESVKTGKFKYMPAFEDMKEEAYYYSDNYFEDSGKTYNEHLMGMSYNLAISTFEIGGYSYSKALLEEIGFKKIKAYDMEEKPTLDTIGMVIAHKKVNEKNLISVAVRGEKYDSEWGNNFIVGTSGNAKGFNNSSEKVINRIKDYISTNKLDNVQIWMVGYSRAGTISDLTGVYINNHLNEFNTTADDLYIYTYEAPAASIDNTVYDNIYVLRSINDLIPNVYPKEWGFYTNGKVINIGTSKKIMTYKGLEEQEEYEEVELNEFYNQFFSWLTSRLDRKTYSEILEEPVSKLFDIYFSKSPEDREKLKNFFMEDVKGEILDKQENFNRIKPKIWSIMGHNSDYLYHTIVDDIIEMLNNVRNTPNGSVLTDQEYNTIIDSLYPMLRLLGPIIVDDSNYYDNIDYEDFYKSQAEDYLLTDEEMGNKYGKENGMCQGYDDGLNNNPKNEYSYEEDDGYGPIYSEAYKNKYIETYLEFYDLGSLHRVNLSERGKYDGAKYAYENGYYAGSQGEEKVLYDQYFNEEDWMTEEYINAYNAAYEENYIKGYDDGLNNPATEEEYPEDKQLYHIFSLIKNANEIMKQHYPQENLKLIHELDSYYTPYDLTEGSNQIVKTDDETDDNITFKTSGHLEKLVKVKVDERDLKDDEYELKSGSTIVILKDSFLKTLSSGPHTIKMIYIDNTIETSFTVENNNQQSNTNDSEKSNSKSTTKKHNPETSDNIMYYIVKLGLSIIVLVGAIYIKKKRFN